MAATITKRDIGAVENAIRSIKLDSEGQFNKDDVIKAAIQDMSQGGAEPGPSERAFVDDLISALDKNGASDTAMVLSGAELKELTTKHESVVSYCGQEGEVAYADVFNHLEKGELGEARLDESGKQAFEVWSDIECDD
jgi:hypothetical protein